MTITAMSAPTANRPRGETLRALAVTPYVGEFGWELMNWQARVRWVIHHTHVDRVIIFGDPGKRRLYDIPNAEHIALDLSALPGIACDDRRVHTDGSAFAPGRLRSALWRRMRIELAQRDLCAVTDLAPPRDVALLSPAYSARMWPTTSDAQRFVSLRSATTDTLTSDVVLVPRHRAHAPQRSLPQTWWDELAGRLRALGLRVELAPATLDAAIDLLSHTRLAAGGSTGGLHLASLCKCPHYVWGGGDDERWTEQNISNRQRYETIWNPLGTPVLYDPLGWQPTVQRAFDGIRRALRRIGRGPGYPDKRASFRRGWSLRRRAAAMWIGPHADVMPWRIRRWVAEKWL